MGMLRKYWYCLLACVYSQLSELKRHFDWRLKASISVCNGRKLLTLDFVIKEFNSQNTFHILQIFVECPLLGEAFPDHCIKLHL